jgi:hypothetical protein
MADALSYDQLRSLAEMLDPALQQQQEAGRGVADRPATQRCGYSLSEAPSGRGGGASTTGDDAAKPATGAPAHPGLVALPARMAHEVEARQAGLPVPSQTKEGREAAAAAAAARAATAKPKPTVNDIWAPDEIDPSFGAGAGVREAPKRATPEYTVTFQHRVGAQDQYLGLDYTRDGSAANADGVSVKIAMPLQQSARDVDLHVKALELALQSPLYALRVALPMKVVETGVTAQWDKAKKVLTVTMQADTTQREYMVM